MKAKDKTKFFIVLILFLSLALGIGYGIYYLTDVVLNGSFLDWFSNNYFQMEELKDPKTNELRIIYTPLWPQLKHFLLTLFLLLLVFFVLSIYLAAHFFARLQVRKSISRTSRMLHAYIHHDIDSDDVFPPSYAEVATQIVQLKSTMQRQEQAVKTETERKNDLIAYLAHDLKTPLTSVIGYLDLLEEAADMPEKQRKKYIHITLEKALRLEKMINEFFEITRYNLQEIILEKETIDLSFMLVQLTDEFYPPAFRSWQYHRTPGRRRPDCLWRFCQAGKGFQQYFEKRNILQLSQFPYQSLCRQAGKRHFYLLYQSGKEHSTGKTKCYF